MRPTQAKDHHSAAESSRGPRPAAPSESSPRRRQPTQAAAGALPGAADAHGDTSPAPRPGAVDADVPTAIGHMLEQVLAERLIRADALDPLFSRELADRVARFTREGGKRTRSQLLWWSMRACGGDDAATAVAALRLGAALELLQTCALVHDDVMDGSTLRRGRPALHADVRDRYGSPRRRPAPPVSVRPPRSWPGTWRSRGPTTWWRRRHSTRERRPRCAGCGATCAPRWWRGSSSTSEVS